MVRKIWAALGLAMLTAPGPMADAQTAEVRSQEPSAVASEAFLEAEALGGEPDSRLGDGAQLTFNSRLSDRFWSVFSDDNDPDGPINTDRPTFTPSYAVVPTGRLQLETGFTFDYKQGPNSRATAYDIPELAMRLGLARRVEFRTFWFGQTWSQSQSRPGGPWTPANGPSDMEVGFKWQLLEENKERKWIPTTALITSIFAPTGGSSPFSSETVDPYINLIYAWKPMDKLTISGSTGYLGQREHLAIRRGRRSDSFDRFHQSLVGFFSPAKRTTVFYEWYVLMPNGSSDDRVLNYMDGGLLYLFTPNMQIDLRVGFGLNGKQGELFTGAGFSVRF